MLLKMLNITHTENTLVGDSFVRGVSGGERKRVSIAEMMTNRARVQCWIIPLVGWTPLPPGFRALSQDHDRCPWPDDFYHSVSTAFARRF